MDTEQKLQEMETEFRKNSSDVELAVALAREHIEAENPHRAKEVLDKIIKTNMDAGEALLLRASILAERHEWTEVERDYRLARKAGAKAPLGEYIKSTYFRKLLMANQGWRPNKLSRIATLIMSASTGLLLTAMGIRLLFEHAILGFMLSLAMGLAFFGGGLMVGGLTLWLKVLQDHLTPGWDKTASAKRK